MKIQRQTYSMEMHCCGPSDEWPELDMALTDGGGGEYIVLTAKHWAIDNEAEVDKLADALKAMLKHATKE